MEESRRLSSEATSLLIWPEGPVTRLAVARQGPSASGVRLATCYAIVLAILVDGQVEGNETIAGVTNGLALFRRQLAKPVEPFTQTRLFLPLARNNA